MPASKAEQAVEALKTLLQTVPDASVERNSVLPENIPDGGLIILRDGNPGEPEQALGGFANAYYQHAVEIEVYVEEGDARYQRSSCTPASSSTRSHWSSPARARRRRALTPSPRVRHVSPRPRAARRPA
jgi:hypothetical protein